MRLSVSLLIVGAYGTARSGIAVFKEFGGIIEVTFIEPDQLDDATRERVRAAVSSAVETTRSVSPTPKPESLWASATSSQLMTRRVVQTSLPRSDEISPTLAHNPEQKWGTFAPVVHPSVTPHAPTVLVTDKVATRTSPKVNHVYVTPRATNVTHGPSNSSIGKPQSSTTGLPRTVTISKDKKPTDEVTTKVAAQRGQTSGARSRENSGDSIGLLIIIVLSAIQMAGL